MTLLCDKSSLELAMAVAQEESRSMLPAVPAPAPRLAPRLVVVGEARSPRPLHNPLDWKVVEPRRTVNELHTLCFRRNRNISKQFTAQMVKMYMYKIIFFITGEQLAP